MLVLQNGCIYSSRAYAYVCAPSNSDVDFLLSQVSHSEKKMDKKTAGNSVKRKE